ncbi:hypothetical protein CEXT_390491 [Caerostris extrusa]|uniref:Uncharacterized protein n=1 Tax=Caerostris extrusa TaxID=172846 RepID=A0AAV4UZU0_CAEEX|nr:hypothetical protein CEXT_390491 [Caerostris extrusa]
MACMAVFSAITCLYKLKNLGKKQRLCTADPPADDDPRLEWGPTHGFCHDKFYYSQHAGVVFHHQMKHVCLFCSYRNKPGLRKQRSIPKPARNEEKKIIPSQLSQSTHQAGTVPRETTPQCVINPMMARTNGFLFASLRALRRLGKVCPKRPSPQICPGLLYQEKQLPLRFVHITRSESRLIEGSRACGRSRSCLSHKRYSMDAVDENRNRKRVNDLEVLESLHVGERFPKIEGVTTCQSSRNRTN